MITIYYQGLPTPTTAPADMLEYFIKHNAAIIFDENNNIVYKKK